MARPFAVIGFTVFLTISLLFDCDTGVTVAAFAAFTAALVVTLFIDKLRKQGALPCIFASAAVACALLFCAEQFVYSPALAYSGKTCEVSAVLTDMPEIKYGNYYYKAKASEIDGKPADLKLRLVFSEPPEAEPYDILQGRFTFYTLGSSDSDFLAANKADGVFLGAYPENYDYSVISVPEREKPFAKKITDLRAAIKNSIYRILPNENGALAVALILGDRSGLSAETAAAFNSSGITHIICVSGLHLSLWSMLIFSVLKKLRVGERAASIIAAFGVVGFMLVAGLTYSVLRSGIMMLVFLLGNVIMKKRDSLNSLGFSIAVIALVNPFAVGSAGLELSALSTLGVILCSDFVLPKIKRVFGKIKYKSLTSFLSGIASSLAVTGAASLFTLPVILKLYGSFNPMVFAANIVAVPAAQACIVLCALGAALGFVPFSFINLPGFLGGMIAEFICDFAKSIASVELLRLSLSESGAEMFICAFLVFITLAVLTVKFGKAKPASACTACVIFAAVVFTAFSLSERNETRLHIVGCGNGTAVIASRGGENLLIGCGGTNFMTALNIDRVIERAGGKITAAFIPDGSEESAAFFIKTAASHRPAAVYTDCLVSGASLLLADSKINGFSQQYLSKNFTVNSYNFDNNYCVIIENDDICALICFDEHFDMSLLGDFDGADVVVSCGAYPTGIEEYSFKYAALNTADGLKLLPSSAVGSRAAGGICIIADKGSFSVESEGYGDGA